LIFIGLVVALVIFNILWIIKDQSPPLWDMAAHSARSVDFGKFIQGFHPRAILNYVSIYPPFTYLLTGSLYSILGFSEDIPQFSLLIYLIVYLVSIYGIAHKLFSRKSVALFAVFLASVYPLLVHFSRIYDLDFPLTALLALSLYALLRTGYFTNLKWSVALGVIVALGMLTKWTFVIFFLGPLVVYLFAFKKTNDSLAENELSRKVFRRNLLMAVMVALVIAVPWYWQNFFDVLKSSIATRNNVFSVPYENIISIGNINYYILKTIKSVTWPLALLMLTGIIFSFLRHKKEDWFLLSWILLPYFLMTFLIYSKESRYFLPEYPALAIISAGTILSLKKIWLKRTLVIGGVIIGIFIWIETSWGILFLPWKFYQQIGFFRTYGYFVPSTEDVGYGFTRPTQYQTAIKEIPRAILADRSKRKVSAESPSKILVVPNSIFLTAAQIQFYGNLIGLKADYSLSSKVRVKDFRKFLPQADYIITKTGDQGPSIWSPHLKDIQEESENPESEIFSKYELIDTWPLNGIEAENQTARLYRRKD